MAISTSQTADFDRDDYRKRSQELLTAIEETTANFGRMSDRFAEIEDRFETFGERTADLRTTRRSLEESSH